MLLKKLWKFMLDDEGELMLMGWLMAVLISIGAFANMSDLYADGVSNNSPKFLRMVLWLAIFSSVAYSFGKRIMRRYRELNPR